MPHLAAHILRRASRWQSTGLHADHLEHFGDDGLERVGGDLAVDQRVVAQAHGLLVRTAFLSLEGTVGGESCIRGRKLCLDGGMLGLRLGSVVRGPLEHRLELMLHLQHDRRSA